MGQGGLGGHDHLYGILALPFTLAEPPHPIVNAHLGSSMQTQLYEYFWLCCYPDWAYFGTTGKLTVHHHLYTVAACQINSLTGTKSSFN
uniref:Uncharacterized protein n=1 Tax=Anguilla anguilla TaxID=7936 RepID=A0A0E9XGY3_ANGAN